MGKTVASISKTDAKRKLTKYQVVARMTQGAGKSKKIIQ